jgi:hypothetical protein
LLVSLNLNTSEESGPDIAVSRFLDQAAKIAVVFYGLVVTVLVIRCFLTPYTYSLLRDLAVQNGRTLPPFSAHLEEAVRTLAVQACLFTAPLAVFMRLPLSRGEDEPSRRSPGIDPVLDPDQV